MSTRRGSALEIKEVKSNTKEKVEDKVEPSGKVETIVPTGSKKRGLKPRMARK